MNLAQIYASESGKLIKKHLENVIEKMDKVTDVNINLSKDEIAIEVLSDIKTIKKLKEILQLTQLEDSKSPIDKKEIGKKYGLTS